MRIVGFGSDPQLMFFGSFVNFDDRLFSFGINFWFNLFLNNAEIVETAQATMTASVVSKLHRRPNAKHGNRL
jgi:hypothetical protein